MTSIDSHAGAAALLHLAADTVESNGLFRQGFYGGPAFDTPGAPMCLDGALRYANHLIYDLPYFSSSEALSKATIALCALVPEVPADDPRARTRHPLHHYNDFVCTGKDEAVAVLRDAALKMTPDAMRVAA